MWRKRSFSALSLTALAIALLAAGYSYSPYLVAVRGFDLVIVAALGAIAIGVKRRVWVLAIAVIALGIAIHHRGRFESAKEVVLSAPQEQVERLGKHLMIGYRDVDALAPLVQRRAFGGLYVTKRNVDNRSIGAIRAELIKLTAGRPLLIAADQEGGPVSRLSPPLELLPPISTIDADQIERYAADHAKGLWSLGINVNFAPVIDLGRERAESWFDLHTRINDRVISDQPEKVAKIAEKYAIALAGNGVAPTFKHFPGLGRVPEDIHHFPAKLDATREELERSDWIPFRFAAQIDPSLLMIGHVVLTQIDPEHTALRSRPVVQDILRKDFGYRGVIVTDDLCMAPAFHGSGGIEAAAVEALQAGVDLLLVSFDGDQYYRVMAALIEAENAGILNSADMTASRARLDRLLSALSR